MKRIIFISLVLFFSLGTILAQSGAEIKFDKTSHNFGEFSKKNPIVNTIFTYTNIGDVPLVIQQAHASCGCTIPEFTKEPVMPGKKGTVKVTYDGNGKDPGFFEKSIILHTNSKTEIIRLYIEGTMKEK
ncbi:hypothetical protein EZS27_019198 [termite gut metagenome]|uniref:DUF1573 domain-containing protein n=1 Tax=termite gut metagenome TaxID=433724 RepID=A0A5J4RGV9_9ZZZZ